jgi:hypothetical protein
MLVPRPASQGIQWVCFVTQPTSPGCHQLLASKQPLLYRINP